MGQFVVNVGLPSFIHPNGKEYMGLTNGSNSTGHIVDEWCLDDDATLFTKWKAVRDASGGTASAFASALSTNLPAVHAYVVNWSPADQLSLKAWFDRKRQRGASL